MVDTRAYFTAAESFCIFVSNYDVKRLTNKTNKILVKKYPFSECTSLVPINLNYSLNSTLGSGKITSYIRNITPIYDYHLSVLVGIIITDGWLQLGKSNWNARFGFKQGLINFEYMWHVYQILSHFCPSVPHPTKNYMRGQIHYYIELQTRTYPFFTILHSLFYNNKITTLPATEILFQLITPVSLANMIMCDGTRIN